MSPGTNPISFSSRADSCDNALRVTRALFQFANSLSIFVINFTIILRDFVKVVVRYVSENAIDLGSLFECYAALSCFCLSPTMLHLFPRLARKYA